MRRITLFVALSGVPALGYQLNWTRLFAIGLGHEWPAAIAVVGAFFFGLAIGAFALDRRIAQSARPALWFAALEAVIGCWGLVSPWLIGYGNELAPILVGATPHPLRYWLIATLLPWLVLAPATIAMGGTLTAADRLIHAVLPAGPRIGRAYAWNTAGAAAGVLLATFALMPRLGPEGAVRLLGVANLSLALVLLWHARTAATAPAATVERPVRTGRSRRALARALVLTGFLGIGFEVLMLRGMAQVFEGTIYSLAAALVVYLVGTALGGAAYQRFLATRGERRTLTPLVLGTALSCLAAYAALPLVRHGYRALRLALGDGMAAVATAEVLSAIPLLLLPTICMGALFCHLAEASRNAAGGIGWALGMNTAGGLAAPAIVGVVLVPHLGLRWSAAVVACGYLLLAFRPGPVPRWALALPLVGAFLLPSETSLVKLREGERIIEHRTGVLASVTVTDRPDQRNLRINNRFQMAGTSVRALRIQRLEAHLPLLLHPAPREALFLGIGSGISAGAALAHPGLSVDAVELVPETVAVLDRFSSHNNAVAESPDARVLAGDARRFVRTTKRRYDVVVGDLFHPARDGAAFLYTVEHFAAIEQRLAAGGIYCQWLPLYQLSPEMLRLTLRSFAAVFPHFEVWLAGIDPEYPALGLLGSREPPEFDSGRVARIIAGGGPLQSQLRQAAIRNPVQLATLFVAGEDTLRRVMGDGPLNRDAFPRMLFEAPAFTYERGVAPYRTLDALFRETSRLETPERAAARFATGSARLEAAFRARDIYFEALLAFDRIDTATAVTAFSAAAAESRDFTLAYSHAARLPWPKVNACHSVRGHEDSADARHLPSQRAPRHRARMAPPAASACVRCRHDSGFHRRPSDSHRPATHRPEQLRGATDRPGPEPLVAPHSLALSPDRGSPSCRHPATVRHNHRRHARDQMIHYHSDD